MFAIPGVKPGFDVIQYAGFPQRILAWVGSLVTHLSSFVFQFSLLLFSRDHDHAFPPAHGQKDKACDRLKTTKRAKE